SSADVSLPDDGITAIFLAAGPTGAVQRQLRDIERICADAHADERVTYRGEASRALWRSIAEFAGTDAADQRLRLKVSVPPADIGRAVDALDQAGRRASTVPAV